MTVIASHPPHHAAAERLLRAVMGNRVPNRMLSVVCGVLCAKERFEYEGYIVGLKEAVPVLEAAERYAAWAEQVLSGTA